MPRRFFALCSALYFRAPSARFDIFAGRVLEYRLNCLKRAFKEALGA